MSDNVYRIQSYDLISFLQEVQQAVQQGSVLDLVTNEHYPQQLGTIFIATLVQGEEEVKKVVVAEAVLEVTVDSSQAVAALEELTQKAKEAQAAGVTEGEVPEVEVKVSAAKRGPKKKVAE